MLKDNPMLIFCIVGVMVLLINGGLLLLLLRGKPVKEMEVFLRAARALRDPFKNQEEQRKELRRRIEELEAGKQMGSNDDQE